MARARFLGLIAIAVVACGGRTMLADTPSGEDASVGEDGGVIGQDGGIVFKDATPPPPFDAGPPPIDGAPPPPIDGGTFGGPIQCGSTVCNGSIETCCVTYNGQNLNEICAPIGQCQGASFDCSSEKRCPPNEVCCGHFSQTGQGSDCAPSCQGGFGNPQLCATTAECPAGQTCKPTPFGFKTCRP